MAPSDKVLEAMLQEEEKFERSVAIENKLAMETSHGKYFLIFLSTISLFVVCGVGFSVTKNGKLSIVIENKEADKLTEAIKYIQSTENNSSSEASETTAQFFKTEKDVCFVSEHAHNCLIQLCPEHGVVECFNSVYHLSMGDMSAFITKACDSHVSQTSCHLRKNDNVLIFTPQECNIICKLLWKDDSTLSRPRVDSFSVQLPYISEPLPLFGDIFPMKNLSR